MIKKFMIFIILILFMVHAVSAGGIYEAVFSDHAEAKIHDIVDIKLLIYQSGDILS